nr:PASTA domain-containing protein [Parafrankia irregularis]
MGTVYLATPRAGQAGTTATATTTVGGASDAKAAAGSTTDRLVALKVIRAEFAQLPEYRSRFRREADLARRVARFCTAEVLDVVDPPDGAPYLVTEYVAGPTLYQAVAANGPLASGDLERVAVSVAAALTAIHGAGLVHRDLKPANVLLSSLGPRVIDFGVALAADSTSQVGERMVGTPAFMAPEQVTGTEVTGAADVFAWGGLVLFAGTGRLPFGDGPSPAQMFRVMHSDPNVAGLDPALTEVVRDAMRRDPRSRPSADELLSRLVRLGAVPAPGGGGLMASPAVAAAARDSASDWLTDLALVSPATPAAGTPASGTPAPATPAPGAAGRNTPPPGSPHAPAPGWADSGDRRSAEPDVTMVAPAGRPAAGSPQERPAARRGRRRVVPVLVVALATLLVAAGAAAVQLLPTGSDGRLPTAEATVRSTDGGSRDREEPGSTGPTVSTVSTGQPDDPSATAGDVGSSPAPGDMEGYRPGPPARRATVPNVVGEPIGRAEDRLRAAGFSHFQRDYRLDQAAVDVVTATDPVSGTSANTETIFILTVSSGRGHTTVSDFIGRTERDVRTGLASSGLKMNLVVNNGPSAQGAGLVEKTDPPAGTQVAFDTTVTVTIASTQVNVPDVVGRSRSDARTTLTGYGFDVVEQNQASDRPVGTVLSQSPASGLVTRGATVSLVLAGPPSGGSTDGSGGTAGSGTNPGSSDAPSTAR